MIGLTISLAVICAVGLRLFLFKNTPWYATVIIAILAAAVSYGIHKTVDSMYIHSQTADVELWHGYVKDKERVQKNCQWGWNDWPDSFCTEELTRTVEYNCSSKSGSKKCDTKTQYKSIYPYEVKWFVDTTLGEYQIDRVNRQGTIMPERWNIIKKDDPATKTNSYTNWLLFDRSALEYQTPGKEYKIPGYPKVQDYYNTNLVYDLTGTKTDWNDKIRRFLNKAGHKKQVNVIAVITDKDPMYFNAVMNAWKGGKKNDVIMFFGVDIEADQLKWFNSTSFAKGYGNQQLHLDLRNAMLGHKKFSEINVEEPLELIYSEYNRYEMVNMEYVKDSIHTPTWLIVLTQLIMFGLNVLAAYIADDQFKQNKSKFNY